MDLSFDNALEPRPLWVVGFDAPLGGGPLGEQPLEHAPRHPDHAAVLTDLHPKLHGLPLVIPAGVLAEGQEHRGSLEPGSIMFSRRSQQGPQRQGRLGPRLGPAVLACVL